MSEHVTGTHRSQTVLFPDTIDKYVEKENPVRFIDSFVDSLNHTQSLLRRQGILSELMKDRANNKAIMNLLRIKLEQSIAK